MQVVTLAWAMAAGIAMCSAAFGVGIARVVWADDLLRAQQIDEIRSRTEGHLNRTIVSLEHTIEILKRRLGE